MQTKETSSWKEKIDPAFDKVINPTFKIKGFLAYMPKNNHFWAQTAKVGLSQWH